MSSGAVRTKVLNDRHGRQRMHIDRKCHVMREEIEQLRETIYNLQTAVLVVGAKGIDALHEQASTIRGFVAAQEHLERGLLSRLRFALGLAWKGRFV